MSETFVGAASPRSFPVGTFGSSRRTSGPFIVEQNMDHTVLSPAYDIRKNSSPRSNCKIRQKKWNFLGPQGR